MLLPAGYQVVAETPAPTAAPTPPPQGPVQAPPPSASATTTPPVTNAANPTVSMDVAMRIFGTDVVPFTPTAQFVAASALAGVLRPKKVGSIESRASSGRTCGQLRRGLGFTPMTLPWQVRGRSFHRLSRGLMWSLVISPVDLRLIHEPGEYGRVHLWLQRDSFHAHPVVAAPALAGTLQKLDQALQGPDAVVKQVSNSTLDLGSSPLPKT